VDEITKECGKRKESGGSRSDPGDDETILTMMDTRGGMLGTCLQYDPIRPLGQISLITIPLPLNSPPPTFSHYPMITLTPHTSPIPYSSPGYRPRDPTSLARALTLRQSNIVTPTKMSAIQHSTTPSEDYLMSK
jgi:hypothetical protein